MSWSSLGKALLEKSTEEGENILARLVTHSKNHAYLLFCIFLVLSQFIQYEHYL